LYVEYVYFALFYIICHMQTCNMLLENWYETAYKLEVDEVIN